MNILTIRTDKPVAELALYADRIQQDEFVWEAHRQLADTILVTMKQLLDRNQLQWRDVQGVVCFEGPGSFTGLRIGLTVANTLADDLGIPVVAAGGDAWQSIGIERILHGDSDQLALPQYGALANITIPRK